jgi:ABC-type glycerol-3-phosphate transport system substrate-binding protein
MSKHRWGLTLATAMLLGAAACGGNEQEGTVGDAGTTSTATAASTGAGEKGTLEGAVLPDTAARTAPTP